MVIQRRNSSLLYLSIYLGFLLSNILTSVVFGETGQEIFQKTCSACHTIGGGRRVGPDLAGVNDRRSSDWLMKFVKSSQAMVKSGDAAALALFKEYSEMIMPDQNLNNEEIKSVLAYIQQGAGGGDSQEQTTAEEEIPVTPEEIQVGMDLFQGKVRLANGGAACNSCHHVKNDAVIGGGVLAKELTSVFSRIGGSGVSSILGTPPFPVMQAAYVNHPITQEEVRSLVAFLKHADKEHPLQQPIDFGKRLFTYGAVGTMILIGFYSVIGARRKKRSVNQSIYDRQVKSE